MVEHWIYGVTGIVLFVLGIRALLIQPDLLHRVLAVNIMGAGVFMLLISVAYHGRKLSPDPVPHALVLTGIVVAVSATALALVLGRRLAERANSEKSKSEHGTDNP